MIYKMILAFVAMLMLATVAVAEPPKDKGKPTGVTVQHCFRISFEWTTHKAAKHEMAKPKHHKHAKKPEMNRMPPKSMKWGPGMDHKGPPMGYPGMMSPDNRMGPPMGPGWGGKGPHRGPPMGRPEGRPVDRPMDRKVMMS